MWVDGLGDDWLTYEDAKGSLPTANECRQAVAAEEHAMIAAAAKKKARAMQIIGTLEPDSPVFYAVGSDEDGPRSETTVAGLPDLATAGDVTDDTLMWAEGMGDTWLSYGVIKPLLPGPKASEAQVTILGTDGTERTATVGEVSAMFMSGEIGDDTQIRVDGEEDFQSFGEARAASPRGGEGGESAGGIGAAMEQANAEAWEHTEVRRLQAVDNMAEKQAALAQAKKALREAEEAGEDEERLQELRTEVETVEESLAELKQELAWLDSEMERISEQLTKMFGPQAARAYLRSRKLAMAMQHDEALSSASKDLRALTKEALGGSGTVDLSVRKISARLLRAFVLIAACFCPNPFLGSMQDEDDKEVGLYLTVLRPPKH